ncbi:transcriptional regulator [Rhodoferax lacus]|uniref:Transcriptional regulator n=1 Tax=Rhodoferax lacus TaxID=2184758 RepID=A0A3E1R9I9_9BURK|nr:helix-turn-helix transcriptional regulator [Rhodoferax lacus]RFO96039.1 transcriptional regulator [Rhodoferax lacus]
MDKKYLAALGQQVRSHRRAAAMTQTDLASVCGINRVYVCRIERGTANPSVALVQDLAQALHIDIATLMIEVRSRSEASFPSPLKTDSPSPASPAYPKT